MAPVGDARSQVVPGGIEAKPAHEEMSLTGEFREGAVVELHAQLVSMQLALEAAEVRATKAEKFAVRVPHAHEDPGTGLSVLRGLKRLPLRCLAPREEELARGLDGDSEDALEVTPEKSNKFSQECEEVLVLRSALAERDVEVSKLRAAALHRAAEVSALQVALSRRCEQVEQLQRQLLSSEDNVRIHLAESEADAAQLREVMGVKQRELLELHAKSVASDADCERLQSRVAAQAGELASLAALLESATTQLRQRQALCERLEALLEMGASDRSCGLQTSCRLAPDTSSPTSSTDQLSAEEGPAGSRGSDESSVSEQANTFRALGVGRSVRAHREVVGAPTLSHAEIEGEGEPQEEFHDLERLRFAAVQRRRSLQDDLLRVRTSLRAALENAAVSSQTQQSELLAELEKIGTELDAWREQGRQQVDAISTLHEELQDQRHSAAAAQEGRRQLEDEVQRARGEVQAGQMELSDARVEIDALRAACESRRLEVQRLQQEVISLRHADDRRQAVLATAAEPEVTDLGSGERAREADSQDKILPSRAVAVVEQRRDQELLGLQRHVLVLRTELEEVKEQRAALKRQLRLNVKDDSGCAETTSGGQDGSHLFLIKIAELEAENLQLVEAQRGAEMYIPKIQELEDKLKETQLELQFAVEGQRLLQDDVGSKARMIRELLRQSGLAGRSRSAKLLKVPRLSRRVDAIKEQPLTLEELETALERTLLELAELHNSTGKP